MPRFVVLSHDWPMPHWDLLFEAGPILRAWRLLTEPGPGLNVPAEPNADHRLCYLDYEGPVFGNRGTVYRWDCGTFSGDVGRPDGWVVVLAGSRLRGIARMSRTTSGWAAEFPLHGQDV